MFVHSSYTVIIGALGYASVQICLPKKYFVVVVFKYIESVGLFQPKDIL